MRKATGRPQLQPIGFIELNGDCGAFREGKRIPLAIGSFVHLSTDYVFSNGLRGIFCRK